MVNQLQSVLLATGTLTSILSVFLAPVAWAEPVSTESLSIESSQSRASQNEADSSDAPATTVADWVAQIEASQVQITGVRLEPTEMGLSIVLETAAGDLPTPTTQTVGNALTADIPNAVLALPEGEMFEQFGPAEGIALVSVMNMPDGGVRVSITGADAPPEAQVSMEAGNLVLSVEPGVATAIDTEEDAIELVVTATRTEEEGYQVDEATTGTRTDTPLLEIPQSIQVIPEQVIEDQQVQRLSEALRNVSGVIQGTQSSRTVFDVFQIRGFNTRNILRNGLRDDTNVTVGSALTNVERVEVIKGPASVLYGQGSLGGTINIITKKPLSEPFYSLEGTVGSYDFYRGSLDVSGPLSESETLLYRLNASAQNSESFVDFFETDRYFVAPALTWLISDDTEITFEAEYLDVQQLNDFGLPAVGTVLPNPNGDIPLDRFVGEPAFDEIHRRVFRVGYDFEHRFNEDWQVRNDFQASFRRSDELNVFPIALRPDNRTLERRAARTLETSRTDVYTLDTNLVGNFNTGSVEHELLVGFDWSRQVASGAAGPSEIGPIDLFDPEYGQSPGDLIRVFDNETLTQSFGFYAQDQISLFENLIFVLGGRFDLAREELEDLTDPTSDNSQEDEAFSPRLGVVYLPLEWLSLYASYSRSFQQVTGTTFDNELFEPERGTQYEVGLKADWLDGRLFSTLAFFDLTRSNVQTTDPANPNFSIQTGEQNSQGIELDVRGEILPGWNIIASYAYTNARITEDNRFEVGNRLNNTPENAASLWTTYEIPRGNLQGLGFGAGLFFVGERQGDLENTFSLPSYLRTDAAVYYRRNNFRAALNLKNLFDIEYFESAQNDLRVFPGAPLTVEATVRWEF